jgi:DNA-directed RNA polymerase sigma subunit (sigma70/sigma32)
MTNRAENSALLSYQQCGKRLGVSPARVRQIEQRALKKLRAGLQKLGVKTSLPPTDV